MTTFYVIEQGDCEACEGEGTAMDPNWQQFYEEHLGKNEITDAAFMDWWQARGFAAPPPEESVCGECEGEGKIQRFVELQEALKKLGVMSG